MGLLSKWLGWDKQEKQAYDAQQAANVQAAEIEVQNKEAYKTMWESYQSRMVEAGADYTTNLSTRQAEMAAGGMKTGSGAWERQLRTVDTEYETAIADIRAGETYGALTDYYTEQGGRQGIEYWYGEQYGAMDALPDVYMDRSSQNNNAAISNFIPPGTEMSQQEEIDTMFGKGGQLYNFDWSGITY